ncbi:MAG: BatA domain-containing protein [Phycisphaeraceae bacterium]
MTFGLGMLTFFSPWWAAGAVVAIGLPLLAHLLSRSRYRDAVFPATRFIRQAVEQTTRIEQPRHRLLMLLRWLLLLLVVLAFMRPRWLPEAEAQSGDGGMVVVVLLDASASMQRTEAGATLHERAVRQTNDLLNTLDPARDAAAVVRVAREAQLMLPEPTANLSLLRDRLDAAEPTYESADWPSAVAAVQRLAETSHRPVRVVVISDQQGDAPDFGDAASNRLVVRHIKIDGPAGNAAVRVVDASPYPAVSGRAFTAQIELAYDGRQPRDIDLVATLAGERVQRVVELRPGDRRSFSVSLQAPRDAGVGLFRVAIGGADPIAVDDADGLVLPAEDRTRALVVHGPTVECEQLAQRVAAMLRPGEVEGFVLPEVGTVRVQQAADALREADPARLRTVVLLGPADIDDALADVLKAYTQRGGGVVAFVDDVRLLPPTDRLALPLARAENRRYLEVDRPASGIDFALPPLVVFQGPARAGLAGLTWPGVDPAQTSAGAQALLASENGTPIVAADTLGRGRVVALNTDLSPGPGGLLAEPAFVVLFNELCRYASPGVVLPRPARPGDAMPGVLRDASRVSLPEGVDHDATAIARPGAYLALDAAGEVREGLWAQLDPTESDTRTGKGWADRDAGDPDAALTSASDSAARLIGRAPPIELWPYFATAALLLAAGESLALSRFASGREEGE